MTLEPGDLLMTGRPQASASHAPPEYLKPGDVVEAEIDRIGVFTRTILSEAKESSAASLPAHKITFSDNP
jgi:2-keto-4-pentenoate hydratase/2-oxohepta-3-ene-1,7-dioic acid hydratase in catechol pathway